MSVIIKNVTAFDRAIINDITDKEARTIEFKTIAFEADTIKDAHGNAFVRRKSGKWLCSDDLYETSICSCCKHDTGEPFQYVLYKFCPECGADMREDDNG